MRWTKEAPYSVIAYHLELPFEIKVEKFSAKIQMDLL